MTWLWVIVLVGVIGAIAVVVARRSDAMVEVYDDRADATLPTSRLLTADDIAGVRFSTGVRGYRMDEVDAFVERVQQDLLARRPDGNPSGVDRTSRTQADRTGSTDLDGPARTGDSGLDEPARTGDSGLEGPARTRDTGLDGPARTGDAALELPPSPRTPPSGASTGSASP